MCFIAYTIKGYGLPFQGHKDNHSGLMTKAQMQELRAREGINQGEEWERFAGLDAAAGARSRASCSACRSCRRAGAG